MWREWCVGCVCACGVVSPCVLCVHVVLCRCGRCAVVGVVCCVGCGVWCCVVVWVVCCVGVVCCVFVFLCCFAFFLVNSLLSLSCSRLLSLLSLFSLLSSVFSSSSSSLLFPSRPTNTVQSTDQQNWRPTSRHLNVIWRTAGAQQSVVSPPLHSSLLPSLPLLLLKKKGGNFLLQEYFRRGIYFLLQFKINSKKSPPGKITVITVLY